MNSNCKTLMLSITLALLFAPLTLAQNKKPVDLTGTWKTNDGAVVKVTQTGQTVRASFISGGHCPNGGDRETFFDGTLEGNSLNGNLTSCTRSKPLVYDCGLESVYQATFKATVQDSSIAGQQFAEGWGFDRKDGHLINCHRDDRYNGYNDFSLTRDDCCSEVQQLKDQVKALEDRLTSLENRLNGSNLTLGSGQSSIQIGDGGVTINSNSNITIKATGNVVIKGAKVTQN